MRHFKRDKAGKYTQGSAPIYRIVALAGLIIGVPFVLATTSSSTETRPATGTTTEQVVVHSEIDTTETTRAQLEALYAGLAQDEKRILDELATASSTATAEIARIQAEFDAVRAEKATKLDAINAVRASF